MAVATVVLAPTTTIPGHVKGSWTSAASLSATTIRIGFVPSVLIWWNATDQTVAGFWSSGMAADTAMTIAAASAQIGSGGITAVTGTAVAAGDTGTPPHTIAGFTIGTNAGVQVANKVFEFIAFR